MSQLILVRHGQASFFADDYDQLSDIGLQQSRLLGSYWANQRLVIHEVYTGPRARQRQSAELVGGEFQQCGLIWPETIVWPELDEYDLDGLVNHFAPRLAERNPEFVRLAQNYLQSEGEENRLREFQRMFEVLLQHWQAGDLSDVNVESWAAFRQRVQRVIRRIQEDSGKKRRVVLFTSGGFIGCAAQHALGVSDAIALELSWRIRNGSLTEFVFTQDRFTLDSFNTFPHLNDPQMWTYR